MNDNSKLENLKELGKSKIVECDDRIQILPIIGEIEGHKAEEAKVKTTKYEHLIPQLFSMEQNEKVKGILIVLNTVGGDVEAGLAIAEMINTLSKPTVSIVIGGGHSIGVPLATASNYSFITKSATMIIHPIRMNGFIIGIPQTFNYFEKMQERINNFIVRTSNISIEDLNKYMSNTGELLNDVGTMLVGEEAVKCGLIDEVGGVYSAINKLESLINEADNMV